MSGQQNAPDVLAADLGHLTSSLPPIWILFYCDDHLIISDSLWEGQNRHPSLNYIPALSIRRFSSLESLKLMSKDLLDIQLHFKLFELDQLASVSTKQCRY
jgi:hypothetical protein